MRATITVEDRPDGILASTVIESASLEDLFSEFRELVSDFRSVKRDGNWRVTVDVKEGGD